VDYANKLLHGKGFAGLHLVGSCEIPKKFHALDKLGFNAGTSYVNLVDFNSGPPLQDYSTYMRKNFQSINQIQETSGLPYIPSVAVGFDASSRTTRPIPIPKSLDGDNLYPFFPIAINRSISVFENYLNKAIKFIKESNHVTKIVNIASWNEWSQFHYIEPDEINGYQYLEVIKKVKKKNL